MYSRRLTVTSCAIRLLSVLLCCSLLASQPAALQSGARRGSQPPQGSRPTQGPPGQNLPNLDDVRRRGPARPKALPPVPSKLKRCPPDDPNCNATASPGKQVVGAEAAGVPAAPSPRASALLGALVGGAYNRYAGVMLASLAGGVPEPPAPPSTPQQAAPSGALRSKGWLSSLAAFFGAGAAPSGVFENADCQNVWGWAWDSAQPNTPIMVALYSDGQLVATALADQLRADITGTTGDGGRHGFRFPLPDSLPTARPTP